MGLHVWLAETLEEEKGRDPAEAQFRDADPHHRGLLEVEDPINTLSPLTSPLVFP